MITKADFEAMIKLKWEFEGMSSLCLYRFYVGEPAKQCHYPHDIDDWQRCERMLNMVFGDDWKKKKRLIYDVADYYKSDRWKRIAVAYPHSIFEFAEAEPSNQGVEDEDE